MTDNRETIAMLKMLKEQALKSHNDTAVLEVKIDSFNFVLDEAIKALEQQPCEDCISRQATVKRLCKIGDFMNEKREGLGSPYIMAALLIQDNKDEFPPVAPKEKTGHWIDTDEWRETVDGFEQWGYFRKCSKCGYVFKFLEIDNYCPNCGAKMQEIEE